MNDRRMCSRCGCSSFHYSSREVRIICDQCGHPFYDPILDHQQQTYDRNLKLAREHLRVGNWDDSKNLVKPLCHHNPSDPQLYLILLASITQGYNNYLCDNIQEQKEAAVYWDKLVSLRSVNSVMRAYAQKRKAETIAKLMNKRDVIYALLFGIAVTLIFSAILTSIFSRILSFSISCFILWRLISFHNPLKVIQELKRQRSSPNDNPFS